MSALLETALSLASRGLHVFPCKPRDKKPALWNGLKGATTDPNIIAGWWRNSDFNIGLATGECSGIFVIDIDGMDAEAELTKLISKHGALPHTVESITARGRHVFFAYPDRAIRNSAGKIAPGIDVRGDGGYVLAPPSVHPSGRNYTWSVDSADAFAAAPNWLLTAAAAKPVAVNGTAAATPATEWHELIKGAAEGTRDNTITRLAGYLLCRRVDPVMALAFLQSWNVTSCTPPLPDEDIARIVDSISSRELRRRGGFGR
jgi:hypothetical protein